MNKEELTKFLEKFNIEKENINKFLQNKKLIEINKNIFLVSKDFKLKQNQVYTDILLFISLKKFLPSKFLLNFIKLNTINQIEIISEKTALNFTYSKNLILEQITKSKERYNKNKNYVVLFKNKVLGIAEFKKQEKNIYFENKMNLGQYLQEI